MAKRNKGVTRGFEVPERLQAKKKPKTAMVTCYKTLAVLFLVCSAVLVIWLYNWPAIPKAGYGNEEFWTTFAFHVGALGAGILFIKAASDEAKEQGVEF